MDGDVVAGARDLHQVGDIGEFAGQAHCALDAQAGIVADDLHAKVKSGAGNHAADRA